MNQNYKVWQNSELAQTFLEGVRGAIPLAHEQIDILSRIIHQVKPQIENFLDLGCGDGILGQSILQQYPQAKGVFLDFSDAMIDVTKTKLSHSHNQVEFILQDFGKPEWGESLKQHAPFDVIVSGFAIHHQPDTRKKEIYQEIYELLKPGGFFLNLEHVSSLNNGVEKIFNELFIDSLYEYHQKQGNHQTREEIAQNYYNRPDKVANILAPVELQCDWLREVGFIEVDCFMKLLEIALFGGLRPLL